MSRLRRDSSYDIPVQSAPQQQRLFAPWSVGPFIATLGCLAVWTLTANPPKWGYVCFGAGVGFGIGVLYFFFQFLGRLFRGQGLGAFLAMLRMTLCVVAIWPAFILVFFVLGDWWGPPDHFADNLIIPSNIEINRPISYQDDLQPGEDDLFQRRVLTALQKPAGNFPVLTPSVPSLRELVQNHRPLLMCYLESSPAWRVYEGRGGLFAARRWQFGSHWISTLNNEYGQADPEGRGNLHGTRTNFALATVLHFNGQTDLPPERFTWMDEGITSGPVAVIPENERNNSSCLIRCGGDVLLEISESSAGQERRLTEAALSQLESEFKGVLDRKEFDPSLLPAGSIKRGAPSLSLYGEHGTYNAEAWVNPGEPGNVYLKAFEITHNTPLADDMLPEGTRNCTELFQDSSERIGWSSDGQELFLSATHFMMYPGAYGKPYAARFELWFQPDSGKPERELLTRNFIIEGYEN